MEFEGVEGLGGARVSPLGHKPSPASAPVRRARGGTNPFRRRSPAATEPAAPVPGEQPAPEGAPAVAAPHADATPVMDEATRAVPPGDTAIAPDGPDGDAEAVLNPESIARLAAAVETAEVAALQARSEATDAQMRAVGLALELNAARRDARARAELVSVDLARDVLRPVLDGLEAARDAAEPADAKDSLTRIYDRTIETMAAHGVPRHEPDATPGGPGTDAAAESPDVPHDAERPEPPVGANAPETSAATADATAETAIDAPVPGAAQPGPAADAVDAAGTTIDAPADGPAPDAATGADATSGPDAAGDELASEDLAVVAADLLDRLEEADALASAYQSKQAMLTREADRTERDLKQVLRNAGAPVLKAQRDFAKDLLVPLFDDLDRAVTDIADAPTRERVDVLRGDALEMARRHGITRFEPTAYDQETNTAGEAFDPGRHNGLPAQAIPGVPARTVLQVLSAGYELAKADGTTEVLRHASVLVSAR